MTIIGGVRVQDAIQTMKKLGYNDIEEKKEPVTCCH